MRDFLALCREQKSSSSSSSSSSGTGKRHRSAEYNITGDGGAEAVTNMKVTEVYCALKADYTTANKKPLTSSKSQELLEQARMRVFNDENNDVSDGAKRRSTRKKVVGGAALGF